MVVQPITEREEVHEVLQGVGGVHITGESGDSTTLDKGRDSACLHGIQDVRKNSIPHRGTRI